jgi:hypothetical protein
MEMTWPRLAVGFALCFSIAGAAAQGLNVLRPTGTYTQAASGMIFPESVGDFTRVNVIRYKPDGTDESAGYNRLEQSHEINGTVYVFPSPSVTSFASPANVIAQARARLCDNVFASVQAEVISAHPDAELLEKAEMSLPQGSSIGHKAIYRVTIANFFGRRQVARSEAYVFCYAGGKWNVEYRFDYPDDYTASAAISVFMHDLPWTIREQP